MQLGSKQISRKTPKRCGTPHLPYRSDITVVGASRQVQLLQCSAISTFEVVDLFFRFGTRSAILKLKAFSPYNTPSAISLRFQIVPRLNESEKNTIICGKFRAVMANKHNDCNHYSTRLTYLPLTTFSTVPNPNINVFRVNALKAKSPKKFLFTL